jgi:hypothetical protein
VPAHELEESARRFDLTYTDISEIYDYTWLGDSHAPATLLNTSQYLEENIDLSCHYKRDLCTQVKSDDKLEDIDDSERALKLRMAMIVSYTTVWKYYEARRDGRKSE